MYNDYSRTYTPGYNGKSRSKIVNTKTPKTLDNPAKSGIIKVGSDEGMYRKSKKGKIEPMPKKQFHRLEKSFKRKGGMIQYNAATDEYLKTKHAEGITYDAKTILLKQNSGRASVFEELIHAHQYRTGKNDGSYLSRLNNEIDAQNKLLRHSKLFQLTQTEIEQTKSALISYKNELTEYYNKGGK
ncbi:MAG: zincin-like metallopeptidase toxin domain-containing protein [Ruminococcus sp.]|nr:zincin-like metallopeptidase toxin domain-containing protein [Ruminococcus sp.]